MINNVISIRTQLERLWERYRLAIEDYQENPCPETLEKRIEAYNAFSRVFLKEDPWPF